VSAVAPGGRERRELDCGWELAETEPGACDGPDGIGRLTWRPARVPGTADADAGSDPDARDWWFRLTFDASPAADGEEVVLVLGGLATIAEVWLNGERVLDSASMFAAHEIDVSHRLHDGPNLLAICCRALAPRLAEPRRPRQRWRTRLVADDGRAEGELAVAAPERWWPHTHGTPVLYRLTLAGPGGEILAARRIGFRSLRAPADLAADGPALTINGVAVFARGAVWTPGDLRRPASAEGDLRPVLERVVAAGMNMLRVPGTAAYESDAFHDLCDELGILVWQDFMFANLDYPESDPAFMAAVAQEARAVLAGRGGRPSLAVLCGGSEVAQQVAMLGLDPALADGPLYGDLLPALVAEAQVDAPYLPSTPWGGTPPFAPDRGVAHYFGVGGYRRPLTDARRAEVRFAAECLALANVPDAEALADLAGPRGEVSLTGPVWKSGVPRDASAAWDFDDVRDHYLRELFDTDPVALRSVDPERYLALSRAVSGEVMAEVMGEWRRAGSPCAGALVLWLRDLAPGAGWGVLDHRGEPKVAYHHLRRALAPLAVWATDEGLGGIVAHLANDTGETVTARLRVALYRDRSVRMQEAAREVVLAPHSVQAHGVEAVIGWFVDVAWAYRFGPPAHDLVAISLERDDGALLSQAFRFPAGRSPGRWTADALGLSAELDHCAGAGGGADADADAARLRVSCARFADGVRIAIPGWTVSDDAFGVEPGHTREIRLAAAGPGAPVPPSVTLTALNLDGQVRLAPSPS
jgi:beta-mannosidase